MNNGVEFLGLIDGAFKFSASGLTLNSGGGPWSLTQNTPSVRVMYEWVKDDGSVVEYPQNEDAYIFSEEIKYSTPGDVEDFSVVDFESRDTNGFTTFSGWTEPVGALMRGMIKTPFYGPWQNGLIFGDGGGGSMSFTKNNIDYHTNSPGAWVTDYEMDYNGLRLQCNFSYSETPHGGGDGYFRQLRIGYMSVVGVSQGVSGSVSFDALKLSINNGWTGVKSYTFADFTHCVLVGGIDNNTPDNYAPSTVIFNRFVTWNFHFDESRLVRISFDYEYRDKLRGLELSWDYVTVETFTTPERSDVVFDASVESQGVGNDWKVVGHEYTWSSKLGDFTSSAISNEIYNGINLFPSFVDSLDDRSMGSVILKDAPNGHLADMLDVRSELTWSGYDIEIDLKDGFVTDIRKVNEVSHAGN